MFTPGNSRLLRRAIASPSSLAIPSFLLPAFQSHPQQSFSTSCPFRSHIGGTPISIPPGVTFAVIPPPATKSKSVAKVSRNRIVSVEGPLGKMEMPIEPYVKVDYDPTTQKVSVGVENREVRKQREMWGTTRAYLQNHILGISEGHTAILRLVGVGYRATVEKKAVTVQPEFEGQEFVSLKVGYSHPIELPVPRGVKATVPQPTRILLEGVEREVVMQFAARIKLWRRPEPYKGKGIFVNGETIKLKAKKIK